MLFLTNRSKLCRLPQLLLSNPKTEKITTYSVSNLRYTGKNNYNDSPHVITLNDGTEVTDYSQAIATNLDTVLGTTDGGSNNPIPGAVFARSNNGTNGGESYITGDFNFTAPATEQKDLTATSYPTSTKYTLWPQSFGAVAAWNCRNTLTTAVTTGTHQR